MFYFIFSSEYSVHFTKIRPGGILCRVKPNNQERRAITDLGTDEMRVLYSPGFNNGEQ